MRRHITFQCEGDTLAGTLDDAAGSAGLLIVSGGNEIRSGAHGGQAQLAQHFARAGHPVFRYDRRGIGDSEGENGEFENSAEDIAAAAATFRKEAPHVARIIAFGNCDAATALALFQVGLPIDTLILANPWVIEQEASGEADEEAPTTPSAAAIRARYWARIKNPRSIIDLFSGKINLRKLLGGLAKASQREEASGLAVRLAKALGGTDWPVQILLAKRDTTALAFYAAWKDAIFEAARSRENIRLTEYDSASHSFADAGAKAWLKAQIGDMLK